MIRYKIDFKTPLGTRFASVVDFNWLACQTRVNHPGFLRISLPGDHPAITGLEHKSQIELWRSDTENGISWYRHFSGLLLRQKWEYKQTPIFDLTALGDLSRLAWRIIAWPASTSNRSLFSGVAAESIAKILVQYNAGTDATALNGRLRDGVIPGITVEADRGSGEILDWACAFDNLLESLQNIASIGGGDFDLIKTGEATWEFRWYAGQLGTDKSAMVIFSESRGNMANPVYTFDRSDEATVVIVGGQGEGLQRVIATRIGVNYTTNNDIEIFCNGSQYATTAGLNSAGDEKLRTVQAKEEFDFDVIQTPACQLMKHYFLGDLVSAVNPCTNVKNTFKIDSVMLGASKEGEETLVIGLATP